MSIRTLNPIKGTSYFATITNCKWLPLFEETTFHDKIYGWFDFMKQRGDEIIGYYIMPNHLHCLIWLREKSPVISEVPGEAKRLISYSIVSRLKKRDSTTYICS
jgi:REP element-mobilizing transposase RayT